jgi:predicted DNA-binding transcriptional regulator AlpA
MNTPPTQTEPRIFRTPDAARRVGLSESSLEKLRCRGDGPPFVRIGSRAVGYLIEDLDAWLASRRAGEVNTDARELFARHLDLSPLRHRPRGVVKCIFHRDKTASLSVDVDKGVFHCFGCAEQGGVRRFAQLVGERAESPSRRPSANETLLEEAQRLLGYEQRRQARMAPWADLSSSMRELLMLEHLVSRTREHATTLGPESVRAWELLADAAAVETFVDAVSADIDGILASGRVA